MPCFPNLSLDINEKTVLVIIDVQDGFYERAVGDIYTDDSHYSDEDEFVGQWDMMIYNTLNLAQKIIDNGGKIIIVKYEDFGDLDEDITNLQYIYHRVSVVEKRDDDGSIEIANDIINDNFDTILVAGLNRSICVSYTVEGLARDHFPYTRIILVDGCIIDEGGDSQDYFISNFDNIEYCSSILSPEKTLSVA